MRSRMTESQHHYEDHCNDAGPALMDSLKSHRHASIKHEGLSGRQLRQARRLAHKYALQCVDDYDAVLQLRAKGVDPFCNLAAKRLNKQIINIKQVRSIENAPPTPVVDVSNRKRFGLMLLIAFALLMVQYQF